MMTDLQIRPYRSQLKYLLKILASQSQRKHAYRWLLSLRKDHLIETRTPWITFDAICYLKNNLSDDIKVFEYGSGGSTLFWLGFNAVCVSVEHDPHWFAAVYDRVGNLAQLDYRLVPPETDQAILVDEDISDPKQYLSGSPDLRGHTFKTYASQIDSYQDAAFDVVLIDGRARPSCIMHSTAKVKVGGLLILDNAERPYYRSKTQPYLQNFRHNSFFGVGPCGLAMWQTSLYVRQT